mmetsp:Transcript_28677/g.42475  ORF Transcript_28677/g.42475 Transcript_28677/m.42475 type:complete len:224 (+) Transcript_28677:758-1429(+)
MDSVSECICRLASIDVVHTDIEIGVRHLGQSLNVEIIRVFSKRIVQLDRNELQPDEAMSGEKSHEHADHQIHIIQQRAREREHPKEQKGPGHLHQREGERSGDQLHEPMVRSDEIRRALQKLELLIHIQILLQTFHVLGDRRPQKDGEDHGRALVGLPQRHAEGLLFVHRQLRHLPRVYALGLVLEDGHHRPQQDDGASRDIRPPLFGKGGVFVSRECDGVLG